MRLTNKTSVGIGILMMADRGTKLGRSPFTLYDMSVVLDISLSYAEQLVVNMREAGWIKGVRGPGGGFFTTEAAKELTVYDIAKAMEADDQDKLGAIQDQKIVATLSSMNLDIEESLKEIKVF